MTALDLQSLLATCITESIRQESRDFEWEKFFRKWFREFGTPAFFLFKRHLGVTNVQYVELFALLETYCTDSYTGGPAPKLLFHTTEQMKSTVTEVVNMLLDSPSSQLGDRIADFAANYSEVLASTAVVDMFFTSCAVFLPPGIAVDLNRICADAGYVHSVGTSIYIRNIRKARQNDFEDSLRSYTTKFSDSPRLTPFIVYAHEDFSEHDKASRDQITRGIDGTKLYVEKMSMGAARLAQVIQDMRISFADSLDIPEAGSYKTQHRFIDPRTIWLIGDRSVSASTPSTPGSDRYYICYQQWAKNDSPFFYFDENKPAWKSHTTLPHSLTAGLINATRPHGPSVQICDPFGGTGTTWLEAKRLGLQAGIRCSDLSPIAPLLVKDNLDFFLLDAAGLTSTMAQLQIVLKAVGRPPRDELQTDLGFGSSAFATHDAPFDRAVALLNKLKAEQPGADQEFTFSPELVTSLTQETFITRIVFCVCLRAELRYQSGFRRRAVTFSKAVERSLTELLEQCALLESLKKRIANHTVAQQGTYRVAPGTYSPVLIPSLIVDGVGASSLLDAEVAIRDACDLEQDSLDVIICDPPYGFNTTEDREALATLYSQFFDAALLALREHGHLIVCLPAESYTGRDLPYCTHSKLVSNQVLRKADKLGKHVFAAGRSIPHRMILPPYYWEAERALRRVILHYRVSSAR